MHFLLFLMMTAGACEKNLDPRSLPRDGRAKDGVADYKISTKLMMELLYAARSREDLPGDFRAEVIAREWPLSPVSSVLVSGTFAPPHRLAGGLARIAVHRTLNGCVVRVRVGGNTWERDIPPGEFLSLFPWLGPRRGLLSCLVLGIKDNPELVGWHSLDATDDAR